jgi:hypothetical protein
VHVHGYPRSAVYDVGEGEPRTRPEKSPRSFLAWGGVADTEGKKRREQNMGVPPRSEDGSGRERPGLLISVLKLGEAREGNETSRAAGEWEQRRVGATDLIHKRRRNQPFLVLYASA